MNTSPEDLSTVLTALGRPEEAVSPETVWRQTEVFYPESWRKRWPHNLVLPGFLKRPEPALSVSRHRLFELSKSLETPEEAVSFYVAVCSWGAATNGQQIYRSVQPLYQPDAPGKLLEALQSVSLGSAVNSYSMFDHSGPSKIRGLGPGFFTKLLYFAAGRPTPSDTRHPLILDSKVAAALGWKKSADWNPSEYAHYLDLVEAVHQQWRPDLPTDVIEYTLFQAGRTPRAPSI